MHRDHFVDDILIASRVPPAQVFGLCVPSWCLPSWPCCCLPGLLAFQVPTLSSTSFMVSRRSFRCLFPNWHGSPKSKQAIASDDRLIHSENASAMPENKCLSNLRGLEIVRRKMVADRSKFGPKSVQKRSKFGPKSIKNRPNSVSGALLDSLRPLLGAKLTPRSIVGRFWGPFWGHFLVIFLIKIRSFFESFFWSIFHRLLIDFEGYFWRYFESKTLSRTEESRAERLPITRLYNEFCIDVLYYDLSTINYYI